MSSLPDFDYVRPTTLRSALAALSTPGARVLAGGTDLLPALRERRPGAARTTLLVDIKRLSEAKGIAIDGGDLRIGALESARTLAAHPDVQRHARALSEAARLSSAPAVRCRATVGGNLLTRHPAADMATSLLALGASAEWAGTRPTEPVDAVLATGVEDDAPDRCMLLAVRIPLGSESAFEKLGRRRAFSRSSASVAAARREGTPRVVFGGGASPPRVVDPERGRDHTGQDPVYEVLLARVLARIEQTA